MKYDAVIFDLFSTLVQFDSRDFLRVLREMADVVEIPYEDFEYFWRVETNHHRVLGRFESVEANIHHIGRALGRQLPEELVTRASDMRYAYTRECLSPGDEIVNLLKAVKAKGYRVGLVSDCSLDVPQVWPDSTLSPHIEHPVFSASERIKKPDVRIFQLAPERLGVPVERCLFVGDGDNRELLGAAAAGMHPVWLKAESMSATPRGKEYLKDWQGPSIEGLGQILDLI